MSLEDDILAALPLPKIEVRRFEVIFANRDNLGYIIRLEERLSIGSVILKEGENFSEKIIPGSEGCVVSYEGKSKAIYVPVIEGEDFDKSKMYILDRNSKN